MINLPKGTKDVLPTESYKWHFIENVIRSLTTEFGVNEIRTPTFEHTELFLRGVGDTTDIVNKEMYTFFDKGQRSITLKPEGTASVARSFIENNLDQEVQPSKMYYITPVFRYEKPQSGRLREHHQFGVELYGSFAALADVEAIMIAKTLFNRLGITEVKLNINSIGCPTCRKVYNEELIKYFSTHIANMCPSCQERLLKNPLRILDCKEHNCIEINKNAPIILDYLCEDCNNHHQQVKYYLSELNINFDVNPRIVRGLDYYTRTVFEFISTSIGAQGTVCGGGRYNNLVSDLGGKATPSVGFGMGIERLIMVMESANLSFGKNEVPLIYIAPLGEEQYIKAYKIVMDLRRQNIASDTDLMQRSLKAQMKYANKKGYKYVVVLGENEVNNGVIDLKNMLDGTVISTPIELLANKLKEDK